jgi:hypothetical protein
MVLCDIFWTSMRGQIRFKKKERPNAAENRIWVVQPLIANTKSLNSWSRIRNPNHAVSSLHSYRLDAGDWFLLLKCWRRSFSYSSVSLLLSEFVPWLYSNSKGGCCFPIDLPARTADNGYPQRVPLIFDVCWPFILHSGQINRRHLQKKTCSCGDLPLRA